MKGEVKKSYVYRVILGFWILLGMSWGALILSEIGTMLQVSVDILLIVDIYAVLLSFLQLVLKTE